MKIVLAVVSCLCSLVAFSQAETNYEKLGVDSVNEIKGYVHHVAPANLQRQYLLVALRFKGNGYNIKDYVCDYGQSFAWEGDGIIKDIAGKELSFATQAQLLNFFNYNSWELLKVNTELQKPEFPVYFYFKKKE